MEQAFFTLLENHSELNVESISVTAHCYCEVAYVKKYLN